MAHDEHMAVLAAFSGGSVNSPKRSRAQLRAQAFLRAFICSVVALGDVHLYLFLSPAPTLNLFAQHLGSHPRVHLLPISSGVRLQQARYTTYLSLLRRRPNITHAVLADASDVVFQSDPLSVVGKRGLYTAEESAGYTLGSHAINAMWVRELYGAAQLAELRSRHVICSGVTMGDTDSVIGYLELMMREGAERLTAARLDELRRKHGRDLCRGLDQGIHNVVMRTRLAATVLPSTGPVFHGNGRRCGTEVALDNRSHKLVYRPSAPVGAVTGAGGDGHGGPAGATAAPLVVAHQYGRVLPPAEQPGSLCQRSVRRVLTCRHGWRQPAYCRRCSELWPAWLGDTANTWQTSAA